MRAAAADGQMRCPAWVKASTIPAEERDFGADNGQSICSLRANASNSSTCVSSNGRQIANCAIPGFRSA